MPRDNNTAEILPISPEFSDDDLAMRFSEKYQDDLRHTAAWGHWHLWEGTRWALDEKLQVYTMARECCREAARECTKNNPKWAKGITSAKTVASVISLARSDPKQAMDKDAWDADPLALNTATHLVDLRTGRCDYHDPEAYCTFITECGPDPKSQCPLWMAFLTRILGGDQELINYLQRVVGYCLTGLTTEHAIFFLYGTGANGKSVFLNILSHILKDYHRSAPMEIFMDSKNDRHPTELAMLRGARLVTAVETEQGKNWAESKIKTLTGGDKINARYMRQDFFEFTPQFKLLIAGNHRPSIKTVDEAMRRRMNLIPFAVTIPEYERDPQLTEKLKAEAPGILSWAIEGSIKWQREGLAAPEAVRLATDTYLQSEDAVGTWLDEKCIRDHNAMESSTALYRSWEVWCKKNGEFPSSIKKFKDKLASHKFEETRKDNIRKFKGLSLIEYESAGNVNND